MSKIAQHAEIVCKIIQKNKQENNCANTKLATMFKDEQMTEMPFINDGFDHTTF